MELERLLRGIEITGGEIPQNCDIENICTDSRECKPGSLFIAVNGAETDGHKFIGAAVKNGASAVVCCTLPQDKELQGAAKYIQVAESRIAAALIARNFYGNPSERIKLVGVTGTNGKTSIATLLYRLFRGLGYECGLLSTIANYVGEKRYETSNTTPGPIELNKLLCEMADAGCEYCFMEVSSHAIDQKRIAGLTFTGGIFTNLTHDHLDYHKSFANYRDCKKCFFDSLGKGAFALINADDRNGAFMAQNCKGEIHYFACRTSAEFKCKVLEKTIEGMLLNINGKEVWCRFLGEYNASNLTAIYGAAMLLGGKEDEIIKGLSTLTSVAGRLEYFKGPDDVIAAVDYAHTPDALENVLSTLKELNPAGGVVCVFGCGGNRDKSKRPEMGEIAAKYADKVIVTSDNPRFEQPEEIIKDIKAGMDIKARAKSLFITDREEAIRSAVMTAPKGSIILVAGKGHEDYQIVNGVKHHFDDREVICNAFEESKLIRK